MITIDACTVDEPTLASSGMVESACHRRDELSDPAFASTVGDVSENSAQHTAEIDPDDIDDEVSAEGQPILEIDALQKHFDVRSTGLLRRVIGRVDAVSDVSFDLHRGQILSLVGESGCGKSTTGRSILRLIEPDGGSVRFGSTAKTSWPSHCATCGDSGKGSRSSSKTPSHPSIRACGLVTSSPNL